LGGRIGNSRTTRLAGSTVDAHIELARPARVDLEADLLVLKVRTRLFHVAAVEDVVAPEAAACLPPCSSRIPHMLRRERGGHCGAIILAVFG
jgi:hypothetical protein